MRTYYAHSISRFGRLKIVASDAGLLAVLWDKKEEIARVRLPSDPILDGKHPVIVQTLKQLDEYFEGRRKAFDLPLAPQGTPFQRKAWEILRTIPFGETLSYQEQAIRLGNPAACRAVGAANGKNLISIIVPCHRVIGKSGSLTGFAGGLGAKSELLVHEKAIRSDQASLV